MCGLFGFVAKEKGPMNMNLIERIATVTERRGRHAWGMAWVDSFGRLKMYKQTGPISKSLDMLGIAADAQMMIGHCRWATHGDPENNLNNHPHPCDGGWVVHNGIISDYQRIADDNQLSMVTKCDSEVVGLLIEQLSGSLMDRCLEATRACKGHNPFAMLGLWRKSMIVARANHQPLHVGETSRGFYLASLTEGLPGKPYEVPNNTVAIFGEGSRKKTPPSPPPKKSVDRRPPAVH